MRVVATLEKLMERQPLERIKVSELCRKAGISRATFYGYFHDVFAVPTWLWDHLMSQSLYQMGITMTCHEGHIKNFHSLQEHKNFFMLAFRSNDYNSVFEHGLRVVKDHIIENASKNAGRDFTKREMLEIEFRNAGAAHMTKVWVRGGMRETSEEMADLFQSFTPRFLIESLEVPSR